MECDFCSNPNVVRRYQCIDFNSESKDVGVLYDHPNAAPLDRNVNLVLDSKNFWAACEHCARYVDEEDIDGLLRYVATVFLSTQGGVPVGLLRHLRHTYELFFKNRIRVKGEQER